MKTHNKDINDVENIVFFGEKENIKGKEKVIKEV